MRIKDIYDCEYEKHIKKITSEFDKTSNLEIIPDELSESDNDLASARRDLKFEDYKWATIKAYYSILHATNAFVRLKGVIINHHLCTYLFLEKLARTGEIDSKYVYTFKAALDNRLEANYGSKYSEVVAIEAIEVAENYNRYIKELSGLAWKK